MACVLPPRRYAPAGPGVFRVGPKWPRSPKTIDPSRAVSSLLGVYPSQPAAPLLASTVTHGNFPKAPRVRFLPPRRLRMPRAFFSTALASGAE